MEENEQMRTACQIYFSVGPHATVLHSFIHMDYNIQMLAKLQEQYQLLIKSQAQREQCFMTHSHEFIATFLEIQDCIYSLIS